MPKLPREIPEGFIGCQPQAAWVRFAMPSKSIQPPQFFRFVATGEVAECGDLSWNAKAGTWLPRNSGGLVGVSNGRYDGSAAFLRPVTESELRSHVARLNGRRGGKKRTAAKAAAARTNGPKGGLRKGQILTSVAVPRH